MNRRELWIVISATVLALAPFLAKAFHIDDTVFVRIAEQILKSPVLPYAFDYNWSTIPMSVWDLNLNPPLTSYLLAAAFLPFGVSEIAAHLLFLLLAVGSAALMFDLARRWCPTPKAAVLACVLSPSFLVNATNVMADIPLLFSWLLAVWFVVLAVERDEPVWLWAAGAALSCAAMSKYFGLAATPLVAVYWRMKVRRWSLHDTAFLMPIAVIAAWCLYSYFETGLIHPLSASRFAAGVERSFGENGAAVLTYLGGSFLWPVFALPFAVLLDRPRRIACLVVAVVAWLVVGRETGGLVAAHWMLMTLGGCFLLVSAASSVKKADPETVLLSLWFGGTLFFCVFINWTVNVRILLPALFPATVLAMRGLKDDRLRWVWIPTAAVALFITAADYGWAGAVAEHARKHAKTESGQVHFIGHWGFQYYMEEGGAVALNYENPKMKAGDRLVMSLNNTFEPALPSSLRGRLGDAVLVEAVNPLQAATVDNFYHRAGFYSNAFGVIPYFIGSARFYDKYRIGAVH